MKRVFTLAVLGVLVASVAQAAPITVSTGDFVIFNFDLTGETPPPLYAMVGMSVDWTSSRRRVAGLVAFVSLWTKESGRSGPNWMGRVSTSSPSPRSTWTRSGTSPR